MEEQKQWSCPTCSAPVATPYCPDCGESERHTHELTLKVLVGHFFEAFTNIDGRLLRSFRYLVTRPGTLTNAYLRGQRKPYLGPVALFLIINVLFFAVESLTGGKVFNAPLDSHLHTQPWSEAIQGLVTRKLEATHTTLAAYAPVFDQAVAVKARSLIVFMALAFSLAPALAFMRSKRPLVAHVVFSLHVYAFFLLLLCAATAIPFTSGLLGGPGFDSVPLDNAIAIGILIASSVYLYLAVRTVYGAQGLVLVLKTFALTVAVAAAVLGYRFALLLVTLYTT
jgi:Protein of unknown function (DUF3667)